MTENKDKRCQAPVYHAGIWQSSPCGNKAKVEFNGSWYCGIHDPRKVAKKHIARQKKRDEAKKVSDERWRRRVAEEHFCQEMPTEYLESHKFNESRRKA